MSAREDRFWAKVEKTDGCWNWTAARHKKGHGQVNFNGRVQYAHRVAYELLVGPIPSGLLLDHICRNPPCVRPDHLRPVRGKQNQENRRGASYISTSGALGVFRWKDRWAVQVTHNRRRYWGGRHLSIAEANKAAIALRNQLFTHNDLDRGRSGSCCALHTTTCGEFDYCCQACPILYEPRWNILHTGLVLASFVAGFGWWAIV